MQLEEKGPLSGKTICITRSLEQSQGMAELIKKRGGIPFLFPTVKQIAVDLSEEEILLLRGLSDKDWIILTSANGVRFFLEALKKAEVDIEKAGFSIACVGPQTSAAASSAGLKVILVPDEFTGMSLAETIKKSVPVGSRIVYPRPEKISKDLKNELEQAGYNFDEIVVYRTVPDNSYVEEAVSAFSSGTIDAVTFTSGSTVRNFLALLQPHIDVFQALESVVVAVIGPSTKKAAEKLDIRVDVMPEDYTVVAMLDALEKYFSGKI